MVLSIFGEVLSLRDQSCVQEHGHPARTMDRRANPLLDGDTILVLMLVDGCKVYYSCQLVIF